MLAKFVILDGRISLAWMAQFETHRFGKAEAEDFIKETLPHLTDLLGGQSFMMDSPRHQGRSRKLLVVAPPPQRSFGEVLRVIREDLWLSRMFAGLDDRGRWTFEIPDE